MSKIKKPTSNDKASNPIREVKEKYKVAEFYRDVVNNKEHPVSKSWIMAFVEKWVLWARDCDTAMNAAYYVEYAGLPWDTLMNWCEKYPEVKRAYNQVNRFIALRREQQYIDTNGNALAFMMPHYDENYRAQHKFRSDLRKDEKDNVASRLVLEIPDLWERKKNEEDTVE